MLNDLEKLKKYESWFNSAINSGYIRALWKSDFDVLVPIYEKWFGVKANVCMGCGKVKLEFMKKLGIMYYKKLEEYVERCRQKDEEICSKCRSEGESKVNSKNVGRGKKPKRDI